MSGAALFFALSLLGTGHLVLAALRPRRTRGPAELHATAAALGAALAMALYTARAGLGSDPAAAAVWARGLLVLGALGLVPAVLGTRRALERGVVPPEAWRPLHVVGAGALALLAALAVFVAASMPVHVFDPVFHFAHKGKLIYHEGLGTAAWTDLEGTLGRVLTHPDYPPGVPALQALVSGLSSAFDAEAARAALGGLFALAPAAWLYAALRGSGRAAALSAALLWLGLPILYYTQAPNDEPHFAAVGLLLGHEGAAQRFPSAGPWYRADGWVLDGAGDLPLAALVLGALLHLARLFEPGAKRADRVDVVAGGALLAGAALVKNEGLALAVVAAAALVGATLLRRLAQRAPGPAVAAPGEPPIRRMLAAAAVFIALVAPWLVLRAGLPSVDEAYPSRLAPTELLAHADRAGEVARGFLGSFGNPLHWNLLWPAFLAALLWRAARPVQLAAHPALPFALFVLLGVAVYSLVLLVTPWDLELLFRSVIPGRLLLHLAPAAVLVTVSLSFGPPAEPET